MTLTVPTPQPEPAEIPLLSRLCALIVEDSDNDALILTKMVERECQRFRSVRVQNRAEMESALDQESFDIILCDHDMPEFSALGALEVRNERKLDVPFIIVTGAIGGEEVAIDLMRRGVADFVPKHKMGRLMPALRREVRESVIRQAKRDADEALRRKNAELELTLEHYTRSQAELVRAGRMKGLGRMVAGISHDMNNALSRAFGLVEKLSRSACPDTSADLGLIRGAIDDAAKIAKRLTYFCDVHPREGHGKEVDITTAINASLDACRAQFGIEGEGGARIEVVSNLRETPPVYGDEPQFRDAITTLVFNACDAMPDGGRLKISSYRNTGAVVVEIEDSGFGMSPEELRRNLEPYLEGDEEVAPGFGFAWINALLERYGGTLRAESAEGLGTKVHLRFSICEEQGSGAPKSEGDVQEGQTSLKVLVVDDERVIVECLTSYLEDEHHLVKTAHSGYEALESLRDEYFDLVISDRAMQDFGGEELARRLLERGTGEKFIMATGSGDLLIANCQKLDGVDVILPKPITREALRRAIQETGVYLPA